MVLELTRLGSVDLHEAQTMQMLSLPPSKVVVESSSNCNSYKSDSYQGVASTKASNAILDGEEEDETKEEDEG